MILTSTDSKECVVVHFDDDTVYEETESLTVSLSQSGQQGIQLSPDTATIFITNDDGEICKPVVSCFISPLSISQMYRLVLWSLHIQLVNVT